MPLVVVTTLYKSVNERKKEIGTMKAIGTKPIYIPSMFLSRIDWFYRSKSGIAAVLVLHIYYLYPEPQEEGFILLLSFLQMNLFKYDLCH